MNAHRLVLRRALQLFLFGGMLIALAVLRPAPVAHAASFTVNSTTDAVDAAPGNGVCATAGGVCTLRAAIQEANALAGDDTITVPAGTYTLTIAGTGEDAAATGDLDLTSNITINGAGAGTSIIDGGALDRAFHVTGAFTVNVSGVTVRNGNIAGNGGGIWNVSGTLTITNSTFSGNSASGGGAGGGIIHSAGTLTITNSTFSGNSAGNGGVIHNSSTLIITNSTFSGNSASQVGGGIYNFSGTLTITNSTFSGNSAGVLIGGIYNQPSSTVTLRNTIVANSTGANCYAGRITNGGNNIDDGTTCGWGSTNGSMSNTNPLLGALGSNGGPTQTMALGAGSAAINAANPANCPTTDQRDFGRVGTCDIGAFEYGAKGNTTTTLTGPSGNYTSPQAFTFTATVVDASLTAPVKGGAPRAPAQTGTVTFYDNGVAIPTCTNVPLVGGVATCTVVLGAGTHVIRADYSGDANYAPSTSTTTLTLTIAQAVTVSVPVAPAAPKEVPEGDTLLLLGGGMSGLGVWLRWQWSKRFKK